MQFPPHTPALAELIGIGGFCLYVTTYSLLTLRFISGNSVIYFCMNLTAASCVLTGLTVSFNLAAALIQVFWITMSLIGIAMRLTRGPTVRSEPGRSPAHNINTRSVGRVGS